MRHIGLTRLYLDDPYLREFDADVTASAEEWCTLSRTAFHPGGGGQPHDRGRLTIRGRDVPVLEIREDDKGLIWHRAGLDLAPGERVRGAIDWPFRYILMRHHALMHVVNTVAWRQFGGLITGVQIGSDRSRIDFRLGDFGRERIGEFESHVNTTIDRELPISSSIAKPRRFA